RPSDLTTNPFLPNHATRARVAAVVEAVDALRSPAPFHGRLQVRTAWLRPGPEKSSNSIESPGAWRAMGPNSGPHAGGQQAPYPLAHILLGAHCLAPPCLCSLPYLTLPCPC